MDSITKFATTFVAGALLAGCGSEDFTGSYRASDPSNEKIELVLNIHGDKAELIGQETSTGRIKPLVKMTLSVKGGKLLLDDVNSSERLAMKRNVDEQSLDCLNCKILRIKDETVWKFDPKGPYDIDQMLKAQARKDEEKLNAALAEIQQKALEQGMRDSEAQKLTPYEGDWVYQRVTKQDPLTIMTIWRKSQIKSWSFRFENMNRLGQEVPGFEVMETGLKVGSGSSTHLYSLSADKNILTCMDCSKPEHWVKADPKKDLSDRYYARQLAGNP